MIKKVFGLLYVLNFLCNSVTASCRTHVCLNWKVSINEFMLTCKVDNLHLRVIIGDQYGNTQADCLPPRPYSKCDPYYKNGSISQNSRTNETIYIVKGNIDYHINGNWTCRHGTRKDVAHVEVTVLRIHDTKNDIGSLHNNNNSGYTTNLPDQNCIQKALLGGTMSVLASIIICLFLLPIVTIRFKRVDDCFLMLSNCVCIRLKQSKKILVCKRLVFAVLTVICLGFSALLGWFDDNRCTSQWVVIGLGMAFGFINALLLLQSNDLQEGQLQSFMADVRRDEIESIHASSTGSLRSWYSENEVYDVETSDV